MTSSALVGRRTQRSTIGDRAFAAAAPAVWNSLPEDVLVVHIAEAVPASAQVRAFPAFTGPKALHVTLLSCNVTL